MIEIDINPFISTIGSFKIGWGVIMAVAAGIVAILLFVVMARRYKLQKVHILWLCFLTVICGFVGALLFSIIENLIIYPDAGIITNFSLRADGFLIAVIIAIFIYTRVAKLSFWKALDIGIPCLVLYMAVYRIGCVLVGCCYGLPCDKPWAVIYDNPSSVAPKGTPIYPTQLFHLIWNVIVLVVVWLSRKKFTVPGTLGLFAWILYFLGDFVIRFFRGNEPAVLVLSLSGITDLILVVVAAYLLFLRFRTAYSGQEVDS